MAIDRIPGVGPQNSDIAAAVAAPSAATIAAAVAAPSAATIATQVAASVPTLSQINTAVNTQTNNSAIATAVAGAVPTLAQITSTVQSNAGSPFGGTWTTILNSNNIGSTAQSHTFSGLSGYKFLRIVFWPIYESSSQGELYLRFNGDTTSNAYDSYSQYSWSYNGSRTGGQANITSFIIINNYPPFENPSGGNMAFIDIFNATSTTSHKTVWFRGGGTAATSYGGGSNSFNGWGNWQNNAAISSITLLTGNGNITGGANQSRIRILGAN